MGSCELEFTIYSRFRSLLLLTNGLEFRSFFPFGPGLLHRKALANKEIELQFFNHTIKFPCVRAVFIGWLVIVFLNILIAFSFSVFNSFFKIIHTGMCIQSRDAYFGEVEMIRAKIITRLRM